MVDRIKKLIEKEGSNPSAFADYIGIGRSSMNHILNGRNNPSLDVLIKILNKYENINSDWLIFGRQPMYKGEKAFLQTSLFDENEVILPKEPEKIEYRRETEVKQPDSYQKLPEKQIVDIIQKQSKTIAKIMIFYSDNTFESFNPDSKAF